MTKPQRWRNIALAALLAQVATAGCADLTERQQIREDQKIELESYLQEIQNQNGAYAKISLAGKTTLSVNQAGHPLRGVIFELEASALPEIATGETLVLELLPKSDLVLPPSDAAPAVVGAVEGLPEQTVVGPVVNVAIYKFPGATEVALVSGGRLTLPIEPCVPALLESFLGAATLLGEPNLLTDTVTKFRNRQVVANGVLSGTYAPVLGGNKVCGGLGSSQPPIAGGLQFSLNEDTILEAQLSVVDDTPEAIEYSLVTGTTYGSVTLNTDGTFTYIPNANFYGQDSFQFQAFDGFEFSPNNGVAVLFVANVNDAPVAYDVTITDATVAAGTAAGTVTGTDIDHSILTLQYRVDDQPTFGTVLMQQNNQTGTANFTYAIDDEVNLCGIGGGVDTFTFIVSDLLSDSEPKTVTILFTDCGP